MTILLGTVAIGPVAAKAAPVPATYVIQGVPGAAVEVAVDGEVVQSGVAAKDVVGPLDLAAGEHTVTFTTTEWTVESSFAVDRSSQDIVVHWPADAADEPVVTVFRNDVRPVSAGEGRVTVAHTAVVPPADILAGGNVLFSNIANGEFVTAEVPADTYSVEVVPTGGGEALLGPLDLPVEAGVLTRVFAIGAPRDGSMDAVVQVIPLETRSVRAPSSVDTGSAGLAATRVVEISGDEPPVQHLSLLVLMTGLAGGVLVGMRRHG